MRSLPGLRVVATAAISVLTILCGSDYACLRDTLDDRAVQWSSLIVLANLTAVHDPVPMVSKSQSGGNSPDFQFQTYDFQITATIDGASKAGDSIQVVRFINGPGSLKSSICGQAFTPRQIGRSFLLLLRPEADLQWSDREGGPDPRPPELHALKDLVVVHLELASDLGPDGIDDAKYTVTSTRAAEAQFKDDDAKLQVQTLVNAQDDTEEQQAERALLDMGPKAIGALKAYMSQVDGDGQSRLRKVIRELAPPSLLATIQEH